MQNASSAEHVARAPGHPMGRRVIGIEAISLITGTASPALADTMVPSGACPSSRCINSIRAESAPSIHRPTAKGHRWEGLEGRTYEVVRMVAGYKPLIVFCFSTRDYGDRPRLHRQKDHCPLQG